MYCSSCGAAVAKGLSYCNRCGAKLSGVPGDSPSEATTVPDFIVFAMVAVFVFGLGVTIGLLAVMKEVLNFQPGLVLAFAVLCFLMIFGLEGVFISLLLGRRNRRKEAGAAALLNELKTNDLGTPQARALPEPATSVTEHTTRTFDPQYVKRESE